MQRLRQRWRSRQHCCKVSAVSEILSLLNIFYHRYRQDNSEDADAANTFKFSAKGGMRTHTEGQWFTVLKFRRARDNLLCHILLVDTEGTGSINRQRAMDDKLFFVARMESQILMFRDTDVGGNDTAMILEHHLAVANKALKTLDATVQKAASAVEFLLSVGVGRDRCLKSAVIYLVV